MKIGCRWLTVGLELDCQHFRPKSTWVNEFFAKRCVVLNFAFLVFRPNPQKTLIVRNSATGTLGLIAKNTRSTKSCETRFSA